VECELVTHLGRRKHLATGSATSTDILISKPYWDCMTPPQQRSITIHKAERRAGTADVKLLLIRVDESASWLISKSGSGYLEILTFYNLEQIQLRSAVTGAQTNSDASSLCSIQLLVDAG